MILAMNHEHPAAADREFACEIASDLAILEDLLMHASLYVEAYSQGYDPHERAACLALLAEVARHHPCDDLALDLGDSIAERAAGLWAEVRELDCEARSLGLAVG